MENKVFKISMLLALVAIAFINIDINVFKLNSNIDLNSIVQSAIANAESNSESDCFTYNRNEYSESNGFIYLDHVEWCEGTTGSCVWEKYTLKRPSSGGDFKEDCREMGTSNC